MSASSDSGYLLLLGYLPTLLILNENLHSNIIWLMRISCSGQINLALFQTVYYVVEKNMGITYCRDESRLHNASQPLRQSHPACQHVLLIRAWQGRLVNSILFIRPLLCRDLIPIRCINHHVIVRSEEIYNRRPRLGQNGRSDSMKNRLQLVPWHEAKTIAYIDNRAFLRRSHVLVAGAAFDL